MLNSKFDLTNPEWIEIVFENRNKSYGAYDLRKHAGKNMLTALTIVLFSVTGIIIAAKLWYHEPTVLTRHKPTVDVSNKSILVFPDQNSGTKGSDHYSADDHQNSTAKNSGRQTPTNRTTTALNKSPNSSIPVNNTTVENNADAIESDFTTVKPTPVGGIEEWSKFLETHLRYPLLAKQGRISGRPWVSFIVERDGRITNINVDQPAGHGFDEEAVRVLKMSPKWTPGQQDGQIVRVRYTLPVDFHIVHLH